MITGKSDIRSGCSAKGQWKVFEIEIADENWDCITASFFNEACDNFYEFL